MNDSGTDTAPDPIFSPEDGIEGLWVKAYQGEVLGEQLFDRVAAQLEENGEAEHAAKMRVLATMERRTKEAIAPALERAGISTQADPEVLATAEILAGATATISWNELMASFEPITAQYSAMYVRIGELDLAEQAAADLLVAHELALRNFARAELAGQSDTSLDDINALAHMR
jgi:hypothetical protein